jgi:FkbM family methyltransferase
VVSDLKAARRFVRARGLRGRALLRYRAARTANLDVVPPAVDLSGGLIVDAGANVGDWTGAVLTVVPAARVLAIEPNPGPRRELEQRFSGDGRVRIEGRAVAGVPGLVSLQITGHSHGSSLRRPRPETAALYGTPEAWDVVDKLDVEATTIDALIPDDGLALLKVDVQGAELDVLEGAKATLARTTAVLVEVPFLSHYEGDATFPELHEHMRGAGFALAGLSSPFLGTGDLPLWADACYVNRSGG